MGPLRRFIGPIGVGPMEQIIKIKNYSPALHALLES